MTRTVAFFDFDKTLAEGESLWPFLVAAAGMPRCLLAVAQGMAAYLLTPAGEDRRTIVKDILLRRALAGRHVADLAPAIARMRLWPRWLEPAFSALQKHHAAGDHIVVISGSLDLYLPAMLEGVPHDAIISTTMEVEGGVLTGRMAFGNCVRARKAELVAAYLAQHGPFDDSWGYGNAPHDLPMMDLLKHRVVV